MHRQLGRKHRSLTVPKYYAMRRFISASIAINTPRLSRKKWASCYVNPAPRSKSVRGLRLLREVRRILFKTRDGGIRCGQKLCCALPAGRGAGRHAVEFPPFWQVFRAATPALMASNAVVLKHASNVPQCAQMIETIFRDSGFTGWPIHHADDRGRSSGGRDREPACAGGHPHRLRSRRAQSRRCRRATFKKCVLELGGSDPFIVLRDADLDFTSNMAVASRFMNCGQSCIAAKRFILVPEIAEAFLREFKRKPKR